MHSPVVMKATSSVLKSVPSFSFFNSKFIYCCAVARKPKAIYVKAPLNKQNMDCRLSTLMVGQ